jgi:hypothetical protein
MPEATITLRVRLELDGDTLRIGSATTESIELPNQASSITSGIPQAVIKIIEANASRAEAPIFTSFLEQCAGLGLRVEPPSSGSRPYCNVMPALGSRNGKRLSNVHLRSGRVGVDLPPADVDKWNGAEVVYNHGTADRLRIYLKDEEHVAEAVKMVTAAVERRNT